jgi:hypothetical protein
MLIQIKNHAQNHLKNVETNAATIQQYQESLSSDWESLSPKEKAQNFED